MELDENHHNSPNPKKSKYLKKVMEKKLKRSPLKA